MRVFQWAGAATIFVFFSLVTSSFGADIAKIGVVDFQRILETSSAGKMAKTEINKEGKKMEAELKRKGADIEKLKKRLEREALVMSKDKREENEREIRIKINDLKVLQKKYMKDFKIHEARLVKRIQNDVVEVVREVGKREGYLLILEKREGGLLYSPGTIDITDKVIQQYNAKTARDAGSANKK